MEKLTTRLSQTFTSNFYEDGDLFLKKSKDKKISAQPLPHGVVLFKGCLDLEEQLSLVRACVKMADEEPNKGLLPRCKYASTSKKAVPILFYNWPAVPASMKGMKEPTRLLRFGRKMFKTAYEAGRRNGDNMQCPSKYNPGSLYAILYPHGGSFIPHVDGAKGWALSVSVGDSANFFYSETKTSERTYVRLDSGDALIFNGGQLYHGVENIIPDSAPEFWRSEETDICKYDMSRLVLQFRDPQRDQSGLKYYPVFQAIGE
jgi:alkylated DNA repair dioxygenase AlkB